jgi:DNA-binding MarR family transcriptional regulator
MLDRMNQATRKPKAAAHDAIGVLESDEKSDIWQRPGFLVRRLHQIGVAIFLDGMGDLELTPLQFGALTIIARNPGIEQSALCERMGIDRVNAGDIVQRLVKNGLATRRVSKLDRRFKEVFLTNDGLELAASGVERMNDISRRLLGPLTPAEETTFLKLIAKLVNDNNDLGRTVLRRPTQQEVGCGSSERSVMGDVAQLDAVES